MDGLLRCGSFFKLSKSINMIVESFHVHQFLTLSQILIHKCVARIDEIPGFRFSGFNIKRFLFEKYICTSLIKTFSMLIKNHFNLKFCKLRIWKVCMHISYWNRFYVYEKRHSFRKHFFKCKFKITVMQKNISKFYCTKLNYTFL